MTRRHDSHHATSLRGIVALVLAAATLATTACRDVSAPQRAAPSLQLRPVSDTDGAAIVGASAYAPTVRVSDSLGAPAADVPVHFAVTDGEGQVAVADVRTDALGLASAGGWTIGLTPGLHEVSATFGSDPVDATGTSSVRAQAIRAQGASKARFLATAVPARGPLASDARCPVSDSLTPTGWSLPHLAARVQARQPVAIVAIGSSSTAGVGASTADSAYPALVQRHLRRLYPASSVRVANAGIGGQNLAQLLARFDGDVFDAAPQLVILQTGTIDATNGVPADTFVVQLRTAIGRLQERGVDVILLDSQRYPGYGESPRYRDFQRLIARVAAERGVPVARRYAWMTEALQSGTYNWSELLYTDVFHPSDLTYSCTARLITEGMVRAVASAVAH